MSVKRRGTDASVPERKRVQVKQEPDSDSLSMGTPMDASKAPSITSSEEERGLSVDESSVLGSIHFNTRRIQRSFASLNDEEKDLMLELLIAQREGDRLEDRLREERRQLIDERKHPSRTEGSYNDNNSQMGYESHSEVDEGMSHATTANTTSVEEAKTRNETPDLRCQGPARQQSCTSCVLLKKHCFPVPKAHKGQLAALQQLAHNEHTAPSEENHDRLLNASNEYVKDVELQTHKDKISESTNRLLRQNNYLLGQLLAIARRNQYSGF
ncbi:hypothetical protein FQN57_002133 [Myotisia sp. PD_48]|nr:hypothetical protein FQN57_002133 [Myotisia sp. PD_48]